MTGEAILVVEDNPVNLKLLSILLPFYGYVVLTAKSPYEALAVLKDSRPEIILMDLQLPEMNGLELASLIRKQPQFKNIIIIGVSAYAMKLDIQKALRNGFDGYVTKPINTRALPSMIAELLEKKTSVGQSH